MSIDAESALYSRAQHEIDSQSTDQGVWTKALVDADGDKERASLLYVKYRVIQWGEQSPSAPNAVVVCPSSALCDRGTPLPTTTAQGEPEQIQHVLRSAPVEFMGRDAKKLTEGYCRIMKVRNLEHLLIDLVITNRRVLVVPATKNHSDLQWLGLVFGGPLIGGVVSALSSVVISRHHDQSKRAVDAAGSHADGDASFECAVWPRLSMKFEVYVFRRNWTIAGSDWTTIAQFSGPCQYHGANFDAVCELPIHGKVGSTSWLNRPEDIEPIAQVLGYDLTKSKRVHITTNRNPA